jgi:1-pyrroline-5-carboxylate dehydrogenase
MKLILRNTHWFSNIPKWATIDPWKVSKENPHTLSNILDGNVFKSKKTEPLVDPLNGGDFLFNSLPENQKVLDDYVASQKNVPHYGLHNPLRNVHRYMQMGEIFLKIATEMRKPEVEKFFVTLLQRVMPKSYAQCLGEYVVTRRFFENFGGDNPRFFQQSFNVAGDYDGQASTGYRWPFGNVAMIAPFNFPLEIPALQVFGALLTGNRPLLKCDKRVSVVMEQFLLFSQACGLSLNDVNFLNCSNEEMEQIVRKANFRVIQFTGSSKVSEHLCEITKGRVRVEDAGFDWKILGPDVIDSEYVAWQCDQDAYAATGQKCSAQSVLFAHENWIKDGILDKIKNLAQRRKLEDLTIGPILSWNNKRLQDQTDKLLKINGAKLLFGGKPLEDKHNIPEVYGSFKPTAIQISLEEFVKNFDLCS